MRPGQVCEFQFNRVVLVLVRVVYFEGGISWVGIERVNVNFGISQIWSSRHSGIIVIVIIVVIGAVIVNVVINCIVDVVCYENVVDVVVNDIVVVSILIVLVVLIIGDKVTEVNDLF